MKLLLGGVLTIRAVIICGGKITNYDYIKKQINLDDTIICADSGYNHAIKMQLKPSVLVGDFDSIGEIPTDIKTIQYPTKKDLTDTEIAIEYARERQFKNFLIIAGTGSRMDHSLTNILMLKDFLDRNEYAELIDEHNKIMITNSVLNLNGNKNDIVSLIPISTCYGVTTKNLEYPLQNATMYVGKGLGVSNTMTQTIASISITSGTLIVTISKD